MQGNEGHHAQLSLVLNTTLQVEQVTCEICAPTLFD